MTFTTESLEAPDNISETSLDQHGDAAVHAILTFAQTTSSVSGTDRSSSTATKDWDWKGETTRFADHRPSPST